jgi:anaerobic dimethyl sulfoxide reductase subunit C (anchor subunit)
MGTDIRIALTLFTVLAPAGAIAFISMALLTIRSHEKTAEIERLEHYLIVPLAACMIGLIASATHLGTPSNALYVLTGWGRSPLSNEVVSALGFLSMAGLYWLASFSNRIPFLVSRIWLAGVCVTALWLVSMISVVYAIPTIPVWDNSLVSYGLWLLALTTGPLLGVASLVFSGAPVPMSYLRLLLVISGVSLIAGLIVFLMQNSGLTQIKDSFTTAEALVPYYGLCIIVYGILGVIGIVTMAVPVLQRKIPPLRLAIMATALVLIGAIFIRVSFYAMHMTVGL